MNFTLVRQEPETHDTIKFFWQPDKKFDFTPGQYLHWTIPDPQADDRGDNRWFTIASSPTEPEIMNCTKFASDHSSTFKIKLRALKPGDTIAVEGPEGDFTLEEAGDKTLVFVAGGIGITPYRSILKYLHDQDQLRPIHLLYGARTPQDLAFNDLFKDIAATHPEFKLTYIFETPGDFDGPFESGRLNGEMIKSLAGGISDKLVYLSGPEPMIEALENQLKELGQPEEGIKTDFFPGYTVI